MILLKRRCILVQMQSTPSLWTFWSPMSMTASQFTVFSTMRAMSSILNMTPISVRTSWFICTSPWRCSTPWTRSCTSPKGKVGSHSTWPTTAKRRLTLDPQQVLMIAILFMANIGKQVYNDHNGQLAPQIGHFDRKNKTIMSQSCECGPSKDH